MQMVMDHSQLQEKIHERESPSGRGEISPQAHMPDARQNPGVRPPIKVERAPKARLMMPPHEVDQVEQMKRTILDQKGQQWIRRVVKCGGQWDYARNRPVTKEQKKAAAAILGTQVKSRERGKDGKFIADGKVQRSEKDMKEEEGNAKDEKPCNKKSTAMSRTTKRDASQKPPGLSCVVALENALNGRNQEQVLKADGVLFRPTQKALRWQRQHGQKAGPTTKLLGEDFLFNPVAGTAMVRRGTASTSLQHGTVHQAGRTLSIRELPAEVRHRIYRYLVVDTLHYIRPMESSGREQPDLAMTCRQVRAEVLPIYYAENTFAINISPARAAFCTSKSRAGAGCNEGSKSLEAVRNWISALSESRNENGRWLGLIRSWALVYLDPEAGPGTDVEASGTFVVSLGLSKSNRDGDNPSEQEEPIVEIHRDADCIMSSRSDFGSCVVRETPVEMNDVVFDMLDSKGINAESVVELAKKLRCLAKEIRAARCLAAE